MILQEDEKKYQIALSLIEGVGDILGKKLLAQCGSAKEVFYAGKSKVTKINGINKNFIDAIVIGLDWTFSKVANELLQAELKGSFYHCPVKYTRRISKIFTL